MIGVEQLSKLLNKVDFAQALAIHQKYTRVDVTASVKTMLSLAIANQSFLHIHGLVMDGTHEVTLQVDVIQLCNVVGNNGVRVQVNGTINVGEKLRDEQAEVESCRLVVGNQHVVI